MEKNYSCKCGENDIKQFYVSNKSSCKKCILKKQKNKYELWSEEDRKNYIYKQKKWAGENLIKVRVLAAKHRAIKKNILFDIDENYVCELLKKQNYVCKYSGQILQTKYEDFDFIEKGVNKNTISIDRIDSNLGYIKGNIVLTTAIVNIMKNDLSEKMFLDVVGSICNNQNF